MDNISLTAKSGKVLDDLLGQIGKLVEFTGGNKISWLLGVELKHVHEQRVIKLRQTHYIDTILECYGFAEVRPVLMPVDTNVCLSNDQAPGSEEECREMDKHPYAVAVGALHYLADVTRPDIAYAVGYLAKFLQNPGNAHWTAVKHIYQYLCATQNYWLILGGNQSGLVGYSDADGGTHQYCCTVSGYIFLLHGSVISWSSKQQSIVTLLTSKAKYMALLSVA